MYICIYMRGRALLCVASTAHQLYSKPHQSQTKRIFRLLFFFWSWFLITLQLNFREVFTASVGGPFGHKPSLQASVFPLPPSRYSPFTFIAHTFNSAFPFLVKIVIEFGQSCTLELSSHGTRTLTVPWVLAIVTLV